jgi:hypothetical protein
MQRRKALSGEATDLLAARYPISFRDENETNQGGQYHHRCDD